MKTFTVTIYDLTTDTSVVAGHTFEIYSKTYLVDEVQQIVLDNGNLNIVFTGEEYAKVQCVSCENTFEVPLEEDTGDDPYFCEDKPCVSAAYKHYVG